MIACRQLVGEGFVEIRFAPGLREAYGARLSFAAEGEDCQPCAIYLGRDADSLLESTFYEWNQAVQCGNVRFDSRPPPVYWHLYRSGKHELAGRLRGRDWCSASFPPT